MSNFLIHRIGRLADNMRGRWTSRRVPTRLQYQTTECGVAALAMILAYYGRIVSIETIRTLTGVSRDCLNAADILRCGRHFGLNCTAFRSETIGLRRHAFPFVVHANFIHFVVVEGMTADHVLVNDPALGRNRIPLELFDETFTGIVITLRPGETFRPGGQPATPVRDMWQQSSLPSKLNLALAVVSSLLVAIPLVILAPVIGESVTHTLFNRELLSSGQILLFSGVAIGLRLIFYGAQNFSLNRIQRRFCVEQADRTLSAILGQPFAYLSYRLPSELRKTVYNTDLIAQMLFRNFLPVLLTLPPTIVLLLALMFTDATIGGALLIETVLYGLSLVAIFRWQERDDGGISNHDNADFQTLTGNVISIEESKIAGMDHDFVCAGLAADATAARSYQKFSVGQTGAGVAAAVMSWAVLGTTFLLGATGLTTGTLMVADLFSLFILAGALVTSVRPWPTVQGKLDVLRNLLARQADVPKQPDPKTDPPVAGASDQDISDQTQICLQMRSVVFGHSLARPGLLRDVDFDLMRGEQVGITGPSGGGKSTFGELAANLHQPRSGSVQTMANGGHANTSGSRSHTLVAWINKSPFFFEGTVRENLYLWQDNYPGQNVRDALRDACMDDVLASRPGGLDGPVTAYGRNFSGGQRQRLEIARALLHNPSVLILDEALDALDPALEIRLRAAMRRRGCGVVIISHRASTLEACDRTLHFRDGKLSATPSDRASPPAMKGAGNDPLRSIPTEYDDPATDPAILPDTFLAWCKSAGIEVAHVRQTTDPAIATKVTDLARTFGLYARRVNFVVSDWWNCSSSPLLGFKTMDHTPVQLQPCYQGYQLRALPDGRVLTATKASSDIMERNAYRTYPLHDLNNSSIRHLFHRGLRKAIPDIWRSAAASLGLASVVLVVPAALFLLLGSNPEPISFDLVLRISFSFVSVLGIVGLLETARRISLIRVEGQIQLSAMVELVQRLIRLRPAFVRTTLPEDLARMLSTLPRIYENIREGNVRLFFDLATTLVGLALLSVISVRIAVSTGLMLIPAVILPAAFEIPITPLRVKSGRHRVKARRFLFDMLRGIARLQVFGAIAPATRFWHHRYSDEKNVEYRINCLTSVQSLLSDAYLWIAITLLPTVMATGLVHVPLALWHMSVIFLVFWILLQAAHGLGLAVAATIRIGRHLPDLQLLLAAPLEPRNPDLPTEDTLSTSHVRFSYEGTSQPALSDISLSVQPGEIVAIVGPSGGGKSTLIRMLLGFDQPSHGKVSVGGKDLRDIDVLTWRRRVGVVQQDDRVETAGTLRSQVLGMASAGLSEVWQALELATLTDDVLAMPMGIQTIVERDVISTGQEQRLLIARQLLRRPSVLILDEATNAIEEDRQTRILENIRNLGITCILVTHRESAILVADRVHVLDQGNMVWSGPPADLMSQQHLLELIRRERRVEGENL